MLEPDEVRVFLTTPDAAGVLPDADKVLSAADWAHVERFRSDIDRDLARTSRALQRLALSACAPVEGAAWQFEVEAGGKPRVVSPVEALPLEFSVANTRGLTACAVTREWAVGVDVEAVRAEVPMAVVHRCWSPPEIEAFTSRPADDQPRWFAQAWTAKEAYAKARGLGLAIDLRLVTIGVEGSGTGLELDPTLGDDARHWTLSGWSPLPTHVLALCVGSAGRACRLTVEWLGPGAATSPGLAPAVHGRLLS